MADYDRVILPGKEGKIKVIIKGDRISPGHNKKSFAVTSNDPENKKVVISVTAEVKKVFDISKNLYIVGFTGEDLEMETVLTNVSDEPIRIIDYYWLKTNKELEKYRDKLEVKIKEIERGKKYSVVLKKKEEIEQGRYIGELVLTTNSAKFKEKKMRIMVTVNPVVDVSPRSIFYGEMRIRKGEESVFEKKFRLVAMRGDSLKVLSVIPSRDDIEVDIRELQPGKVYQGIVKVRPTNSTTNYTASIKIVTNYAGCEELKVAIQGSVFKSGAE